MKGWPAAFEQAVNRVIAKDGKLVFDLTTVDVRGTLQSGLKATSQTLETLDSAEWQLLYLADNPDNPATLPCPEFWLDGRRLGVLSREELGGL